NLENTQKRNLNDALGKNQSVLNLTKNRDIFSLLLSERLSKISQGISAKISAFPYTPFPEILNQVHSIAGVTRPFFIPFFGHTKSDLYFSANQALKGLKQEGFSLENAMIMVLHHRWLPEPIGPVNKPAWEVTGAKIDLAYEYRGTCFRVSIKGKPYWIFWQPLIPSNLTDRINFFEPNFDRRKNFYPTFTPHIRQRFLLGSIMFLIPRTRKRLDEKFGKAQLFLSNFDDSETSIALLPLTSLEKSGKTSKKRRMRVYCSKGFPRYLLSEIVKGAPPMKNLDWVTSIGSTVINIPYKMVVASKVSQTSKNRKFKHYLVQAGIVLVFFSACIIWFCAIFFEIGIASSLPRQLWFGFLLAAMLPLSTTFLISEHLAHDRFESLCARKRLELRQKIESIENRHIAHRQWILKALERFSEDDSFIIALNSSEKSFQSGLKNWEVSASNFLKKTFYKAYRPPFDLSLRELAAVGRNGFSVEFSRAMRAEKGTNILTKILSAFAGGIISELNPGLLQNIPRSISSNIGGEAKEEMIKEFAMELLPSILGSEATFEILYSLNYPLLLSTGIGQKAILPIFVPSISIPRYLIYWFWSSRHSDLWALNRVLTSENPQKKIFVFVRDKIGEPPKPEEGEDLKFLRPIARQMALTNTPLALRLNFCNTNYLIEGTPGELSNQFVFIGIEPETPITIEVNDFKFKLQLLLMVAIAIIFLLSFTVASDILVPIGKLTHGMKTIERGEFEIRLPNERNDEFGNLFQSFNFMARGVEEAYLMGKMVSNSARSAMETREGESLAQDGMRKEVTILFIGVIDFETLIKTHNPEELLKKLNHHVEFVSKNIIEAGGDIDKLIGDKVLAVFKMDDTRVGAKMALKTVQTLMSEGSSGKTPFPMAVGINSGNVISGLLGSGSRRDFTIIGDSVNLAARVEALAEKIHGTKVVITEATKELLGDSYHFKKLDISSVKGKKHEVTLFQLQDLQ
ncbi:HAMP domain-containing protein, partial [bacterium]|nr:HAMP domain-containing protein [bacterium]